MKVHCALLLAGVSSALAFGGTSNSPDCSYFDGQFRKVHAGYFFPGEAVEAATTTIDSECAEACLEEPRCAAFTTNLGLPYGLGCWLWTHPTTGPMVPTSCIGEECQSYIACDQELCTTQPIDPPNGKYDTCTNGVSCTLTCDEGYVKIADAECAGGTWTAPNCLDENAEEPPLARLTNGESLSYEDVMRTINDAMPLDTTGILGDPDVFNFFAKYATDDGLLSLAEFERFASEDTALEWCPISYPLWGQNNEAADIQSACAEVYANDGDNQCHEALQVYSLFCQIFDCVNKLAPSAWNMLEYIEADCDPNFTPAATFLDEVSVGDKSFKLFKGGRSTFHPVLNTVCADHGGVLAQIERQEEVDAILALNPIEGDPLPNERFSVSFGATDAAEEGVWLNPDGTPLDFAPWLAVQPNNKLWNAAGEDCAVLTDQGFFKDVLCNWGGNYFVCSV